MTNDKTPGGEDAVEMDGAEKTSHTTGGIEDSLNRLGEMFKRRRRVFVVVAIVAFLSVQAVGFFLPGKFVARAALLIQRTRFSQQLNSNPNDPLTIMTRGVTEEDVNSEIAILRSHDVISAVVESTGLGKATPPLYMRILFFPLRVYERLYAWYHDLPYASDEDRAPDSLQRAITAQRLKDSDVLVVEYEAGKPEVAEIVLGELVNQYLTWHLVVRQPMQAEPFFDTQASLVKRELRQLEDELQVLRIGASAVDVEAEMSLQLSIDGGLRVERVEQSRRVAELKAKIRAFDRILQEATTSGTGMATASLRRSIMDDIKAQTLLLELAQVDLETRYTEDFPLVTENRKKIQVTQQALKRERGNVLEHSLTMAEISLDRARAEAELAGLQERQLLLDTQVATSRERLFQLERAALEIDRKHRLFLSAEEKYLMYLTRSESARMDAELDQEHVTNVTVVQEPVASLKPVQPKKSVVLLASLFGGLLMGLLACLWLEIRQMGLTNFIASVLPEESLS